MEQKTILIIEDEPTINRILSNYFLKAGFSVISALNGKRGIELFNEHKIDLVCLDIMLPLINGWQVAQTIREDSFVPIIMMSALSEEEDILKGYSLSVDDYITKPFPPKVLIAKIESLFERIEYTENNVVSGIYDVEGINIDFDSFREDSPLKELLSQDELTGLANRRYLDFYIQNIKKKADDFNDTFGLIFVDIDHFKNINDTYGHNVGDEILKMVSEVLQSSVRNLDLIGRWGGEEFIGVIHISDHRQLKIISEKLRKNIESSSYDYDGLEIKITVSIGGSLYIKNEDPEQLISRADSLMYSAKESGRNRVHIK